MRIVGATDFSGRGDLAVRRAAMLASTISAELMLAHVVEGDQPEHLLWAMESLASNELEATARTAQDSYGIACTARVVRGDAFDAIATLARDVAADLIVMGTHRRNPVKDLFVGTTLERVLRTQTTPVLVASAEDPAGYRTVLAAVDFSECSGHALKVASRLNLLRGIGVTILHVSDPSDSVEPGSSARDIDTRIAADALDAGQKLTHFVQSLGLDDVQYSVRVRPCEGPPAPCIGAVAHEVSADLVILGARGRNQAMKLLLGSVTNDLLKTLNVDVLVVPSTPAPDPSP